MARELKDITLREVSLVNKPANKKKFLFLKEEGRQGGVVVARYCGLPLLE